ncbi:hypothetical protein [uncultured Kordia sp.]|uniref:hypothetical protein n=1 Tax=uncultured Kordia sp. TaxID=507699 RepID=UPI002620CA37|nr:hypothetical protein [uncultured Kordia sp.]
MSTNSNKIIIDALIEKKERLLADIKTIDETLKSLDSNSVKSEVAPVKNISKTEYNSKWSYSKKFVFLLKENNRFLHFREAGNMINSLENTGLTDAELASKLSSGTQTLKTSNTIVKHQVGTNQKNCFWGRPNWLNEDGSIKKEHLYNSDYLSTKISTGSELFDDM